MVKITGLQSGSTENATGSTVKKRAVGSTAVQNRLAFTRPRLQKLSVPPEGRTYYYDSETPGLCCCVTAGGSRTLYVYRKVNRRPVRIRLGRVDELSVDDARKRAVKLAGDMVQGIDPQAERTARRDKPTVKDLFEHWLAHARLHKKTWTCDQEKFDFHFGPIRNKRLNELTPASVSKWHSEIGTNRGTYIANRARALLSAMYGKAHELGHVGPNPCVGVKRFREESRERFLLPDEMRPFFTALKTEPPLWRDFWLLCLFTGGRRGNVAAMTWRSLDLQTGVWYLPGQQMKNGLALAIVLPPPAVAILASRETERGEAEYVFPSENGRNHVKDPRKSWARVLKGAGIEGLRPHDLRRSLGSWQAIAGASLQIIGASLGHRDPKATAVYSRLLMDPVRTSVNGAVQAMLTASEPETPKPTKKKKTAGKAKGASNGKAK